MSTETNTVQTTQQANPFLPQAGGLQRGFSEAGRLYDQRGTAAGQGNTDLYPGGAPNAYDILERTILLNRADPATQNLYTRGRDALGGIVNSGGGYQISEPLSRFRSGEFLSPDSNPWLKGAYEDAAGAVRGQINSQFAGGGRYGSGANQDVLGQNLSKLANTMYGGAYQQGMQQMLSASLLGDQLLAQNPRNVMQASALLPAAVQAKDQDLTQLAFAQQARRDQPWQDLQRYMGILSGGPSFGGTTTGSQPYFSNPFGQAVGAAGGLLGAASNLFGASGLFPNALSGLGNMFGSSNFDLGSGLGQQLSGAGNFGYLGDMIGNVASFDPFSYGYF